MSKKSEFLQWCHKWRYVSSVMASEYGVRNYYHRAERTLREFAELGYCERLNWAQKVSLNLMKPEQQEIAWVKF